MSLYFTARLKQGGIFIAGEDLEGLLVFSNRGNVNNPPQNSSSLTQAVLNKNRQNSEINHSNLSRNHHVGIDSSPTNLYDQSSPDFNPHFRQFSDSPENITNAGTKNKASANEYRALGLVQLNGSLVLKSKLVKENFLHSIINEDITNDSNVSPDNLESNSISSNSNISSTVPNSPNIGQALLDSILFWNNNPSDYSFIAKNQQKAVGGGFADKLAISTKKKLRLTAQNNNSKSEKSEIELINNLSTELSQSQVIRELFKKQKLLSKRKTTETTPETYNLSNQKNTILLSGSSDLDQSQENLKTQTIKEILFLTRKPSQTSFSLNLQNEHVAIVTLNKTNFQIGDSITGQVQFTNKESDTLKGIPCYQLDIWLESYENINHNFVNLPENNLKNISCTKHSEYHTLCRGYSTVGFSLSSSGNLSCHSNENITNSKFGLSSKNNSLCKALSLINNSKYAYPQLINHFFSYKWQLKIQVTLLDLQLDSSINDSEIKENGNIPALSQRLSNNSIDLTTLNDYLVSELTRISRRSFDVDKLLSYPVFKASNDSNLDKSFLNNTNEKSGNSNIEKNTSDSSSLEPSPNTKIAEYDNELTRTSPKQTMFDNFENSPDETNNDIISSRKSSTLDCYTLAQNEPSNVKVDEKINGNAQVPDSKEQKADNNIDINLRKNSKIKQRNSQTFNKKNIDAGQLKTVSVTNYVKKNEDSDKLNSDDKYNKRYSFALGTKLNELDISRSSMSSNLIGANSNANHKSRTLQTFELNHDFETVSLECEIPITILPSVGSIMSLSFKPQSSSSEITGKKDMFGDIANTFIDELELKHNNNKFISSLLTIDSGDEVLNQSKFDTSSDAIWTGFV
ncbi:hypothetical protein BB561_002933 [Smittium simulii]|uniref:Rgp1-domain-containing protein n=1 Tax=Smittium simulii TaxID=133385 RepID=A0A2T9YNL7_9FUNG|nr:hypothetical protein BB561_002933 [Smittium simulii]